MYGQTSRAYQMLVDAYQVVLERMHLKNLVLPAAMIAALCGGMAAKAQADQYAQDPAVNRTIGFQQTHLIYYYDEGQPDFYTRAGSDGYATRYAEAVGKINLMRQFLATQSGGQFDFNMTYDQCQIAAGTSYGANTTLGSANPALTANDPALAATYANYQYHINVIGDASSGIIYPSESEAGAAGMGGGDNLWSRSLDAAVNYHEFGHCLGSPHTGAIYQDTTTPGYTYDFATKTYTAAPTTIGSNPWNQQVVSLPIGTSLNEGGNIFNRMAGGDPGTFDPNTKANFGWLKGKHFASIPVVAGPVGQATPLKLYDASDLRLVSQGTGADLRYGVQQGYQDVSYQASLTRLGEVYDTTTNKWKLAKQRLEFYYQGANTHYGETYPAGRVDPTTQPNGIVVELDGRYVGTLQAGQTIDERTIDQLIANTGTTDYATLAHDDPRDPRTFRRTHYELSFLDANNTDASGVYANFQIKKLTDANLVLDGSQWDPGATGSASQDGVGTWTTGAGSWRNLSTNTAGYNTTGNAWADGGDAIFGANAGTAGTVALGGDVSARSLTFAPVASGHYTLTGGAGDSTLTLGGFGIMAAESATLACKVAFGANQYWTVEDGKTLTLTGAVTSNSNILTKMGQGTLALAGANTWTKEVNVAEGMVVQTADQSFGDRLSLDNGTVYQVNSGTLGVSSNGISAAFVRNFGDSIGSNNPQFRGNGLLRLSSTTGTAAAPELRFNGSATVDANVELAGGTHFISLQNATGTISGDVSGSGGITLYADSGSASGRRLILGGRGATDPSVNTFTGDIEIQRGSLHVVGATSLQGNNVLRFNNAAGDTGRFYLEGFDRSVRDLSSTGAGTAIIANSRGNNGLSGAMPANLKVTQNSNGTYSGIIADTSDDYGGSGSAGALGLVKQGAATLTLTGSNTYTGGTSIAAGTLRVKGADNLGTGTVHLAGGTLSVDQLQGLTRTVLSSPTTMDTTTDPSGGKYTTDLSPLHNTTGNVVPNQTTYAYTGKIHLTAGQWNFGKDFDDGGYLNIDGTPIFSNTVYNQTPTGSINIAADGWYDIDLRVYNNGGGVGAVAANGWTNQGIGISQGAMPADGSGFTAFAPGALGIQLKDRLNIANAISVESDSNLEILDTQSISDVHLTGAISGAAALTKTGAGQVTLEGANTHTGATRISGGMVVAGATNVLGSASAYTLDNATGVALNLNGYDQTIGSLAGGGTVGGTVSLGSGGTLTVGGDNTSTTYAGTLTGSGGLRKVGSGTMRFDFANAPVASNMLDPTVALILGGGTVEFSGKSGVENTQTVNGLTLMANTRSALKLTQNSGGNTVDLRLGNIAVGAGATVDFQGGTTDVAGVPIQGARFSFTTVTTGGVTQTIAKDARLGAFATWNGTDWAANSGVSDGVGGTYIGAYNGYINIYNGTGSIAGTQTAVIPNQAAADVRINESSGNWGNNTLGSASTTINSLMMSAGGNAATVDLMGGQLTVGDGANAAGGIAVAVGARGLTIGVLPTLAQPDNPGSLTSGTSGASTLGLISNNAAAADGLTVNAVIADGGTGTTALMVSGGTGGGTVVLAGDNTYTGGTALTAGATLQVGAGGGTGTLGSGAVALDAGTTLSFNRSDAGLSVTNAISGAGAVVQSGTGTTTLAGANTYAGATTIASGTLQVGDGTTNGTLGTGAVTDNGTLSFNRSDALTVSNAVSGTGALAQIGSGTTVLTGANAYGATLVSAGTLQVGDGGTAGTLGTGAVTVNAPGTLAFNRSDTVTLSNAIGGTGTLAQANGSSTLILTGNNTYGATSIAAGGSVQVGDGHSSGTLGTGTVTNAGTLAFNRSDAALVVSSRITGGGSVEQDGSGTTVLTGANDYTGTTTVNAGTLQVGNGGSSGQLGSGLVTLYGTLAFNRSDTLVVSSAFSGAGSITQAGSGTTVITSDNPIYVGTVTIAAGTLQFGNGGATGSMLAAPIVDNANLAFNHGNSVVAAGVISGTGGVTQMGAGTLILAGNNTYQGATTINEGTTLQVGNGGGVGNLGTGSTVDNGTLVFNRSNTFVLSSVISGNGAVVQNGTGRTQITGINTYTGTTTINAGVLQLGTIGTGTGTLGTGDVIINSGGSLLVMQPDYTTTASVANNITLSGGSLKSEIWGGRTAWNGNLTIAGTGSTIGTGYSSSSDFNGVVSGGSDLTIDNSANNYRYYANSWGSGTVWFNNAANTYSGTLTVLEGRSDANIAPHLGVGAGTALQYATVNLAPSVAANADANMVSFASGVTAATFGGLTGNAWGGMKLQTGTTPVALTVNNAAANQFDGVLSGTGSLTKTGAGQLTMTNANTYTGGTTVSGGTLALDFSATGAPAANILASGSAMTLNGGTLEIIGPSAAPAGTLQTFSSLTSGAGTSTLRLVQTGSTAFDVNVGTLSFGSGTLNFTGLTGTAAGARVITSTSAGSNDGSVQLSAAAALWEGSGWASVKELTPGGTKYVVQWTGTYTDLTTNGLATNPGTATNPTGDLRIKDGTGAGTAANYTANTTIRSLMMVATAPGYSTTVAIGAANTLTIDSGPGAAANMAIATNGNSMTVGQTAGQGTLTAGTTSATTLSLANNNASSTLTINANIANNAGSGAVSVAAAGSGAIIFNGGLSYTGSTTVGTGNRLTLNALLGGGTYAGAITNNGTLRLAGAGSQTLSGVLGGNGTLVTDAGASGTLTLSGASNTFSGAMTVASGTVKLGASSAMGTASATFASGSTLDLNGQNAGAASVTLAGTGVGGNGALISGSTATKAYLKSLTLSGDATVSNDSTQAKILIGSIDGQNGTFDLAGHTLTKNGTGTLILNGINANGAGNIIVNAGSLQLMDDYTGGSQQATTIGGSGTITIKSGASLTTQRWWPALSLTKDIELNGGSIVSSFPGPNGATIASNISLTADSAISMNGSYDSVTFSGVISGNYGLTFSGGSGTRTLGGVNTYSGTTRINNGKLLAGVSGAFSATSAVVMANTAGVNLDLNNLDQSVGSLAGGGSSGGNVLLGSATLTVGGDGTSPAAHVGVISGTGGLIKVGSGTQTLSGANTYTGGTTVNDGTLALDFSASGAAASNILSSSGAVSLNGGTLKIIGKAGQNGTVQTFNGLSSGSGASTLQLVQNGANSLDVNVGALTFGAGTLTFKDLTGSTAGARVITTSSAGANDSTTQLSGASALWEGVGGSGWASIEQVGGVNYVVRWGGPYADIYTNANGGKQIVIADGGASANVRILENGANAVHNSLGAATTTVGSLLMSAGDSSSTIAMNTQSADDKLVVANGNVAITSLGRSLTIGESAGQGTLTAGTTGAATLSLANNSATSTLTVNSKITDNAGAVSVAVGGTGPVILNGALSYTGTTTVGGGASLTANTLLGGGSYTAAITANGTLRLNGSGDQTLSGAVGGSGTIIKGAGTGAGTLTLGSTNTFSGTLTVASGTVKLGANSAMGTASATFASGSTLDLNGQNAGTAAATLAGTGVDGNGALISSGTAKAYLKSLTLAGDATVSSTGTQKILIGSTTGQDGTFDLAGHTLTKNGTGTLILNGVNAVSAGNIVVNAGVLQLMDDYSGGSQRNTTIGGSGAITLNAGASLTTQKWGPTLALTKDIVLNGGAITGQWPGPNGAVVAGNISVTAASSINWGGSLTGVLSGSGNLTVANSTFTGANTYSGNLTVAGGTMQIGGSGVLGSGSYAGAMTLASGATFNDNSSANQTLSGVISGAGALSQTGAGTLTLSGTNTFTGTTNLSAGTLRLDNANALQNSTLNYTGGTLDLGTQTGVLLGGLQGTQNITLQNASSAAVALSVGNNNSTTTYGGNLGGSGSLTKVGTGTLTLSGSNTYTGATTVSGGTLKLDYAIDESKLSDTAMLTLAGGTLELSGGTHDEVVASTTLGAGASKVIGTATTSLLHMGAITRSAGATIDFSAPAIAYTDTLNNTSGILGTWATVGGSDWAVNSTNGADGLITACTYTDLTRLSSGTKVIADGPTSQVRIVEGTGTAANITLGATVTTIGTLNQSASGGASAATIAMAGQTLQVSGILAGAGAGGLTIGSAVGDGILKAATAGGDLTVINNSTNATKINAVIADNTSASTFTKSGTGAVILAGANTYSGGTIVAGGALILKTGSGSLGTGDITLAGGDLGFNPTNTSSTYSLSNAIHVTADSKISNDDGIMTLGGAVDIASGKTLTAGTAGWSGKTLTFSSGISGAGNLTVKASGLTLDSYSTSGSGTVLFSGASTYTGNTAVTNGTMKLSGAGLLGAGGNYAGAMSISGGATFNDASSANQTLSGIVSGTGNLTQSGSGTLTLTGANIYTGTTTVSGGTLLVNGTHNAGSGAYAIHSGGILGGTGTITTAGAVTVAADGKITGADLGTVGDLAIGASAVNLQGSYLFDVNYAALSGAGDADTLDFTGGASTIDFNGFSMNLNSETGVGNANYSIKLMAWDASDTLNNFSLADGGTFMAGGTGGLSANQSVVRRGNALYLQTNHLVPEPGTLALLGLGSLLLLRRPKRRRK